MESIVENASTMAIILSIFSPFPNTHGFLYRSRHYVRLPLPPFGQIQHRKQYFSHRVNDVCNGSPSRIRRVLLISFGMTILPRSSTRRTMPVAFIILFSFEARDARFAPVEVFAGKGELCMGAAAIFFSGCVSFKAIPHRKKCQIPPSVI